MPTEGRRHGSDERWTIYVCGCGAVGGNPSFERAVPCGRRSDGFHDAEPIIVGTVPSELLAENERYKEILKQIDQSCDDTTSLGYIRYLARSMLHPTEETEGTRG